MSKLEGITLGENGIACSLYYLLRKLFQEDKLSKGRVGLNRISQNPAPPLNKIRNLKAVGYILQKTYHVPWSLTETLTKRKSDRPTHRVWCSTYLAKLHWIPLKIITFSFRILNRGGSEIAKKRLKL